jgi:serine/threonine protein kinase
MVGDKARPFQGTERFEVVRRLGAGGMGVVYAARDRELKTMVALKTLKNIDAGSISRFKREFRALADLTHPNLIRLGELFSEGEQWFFTMDLVVGANLLDYVRHSDDTRPDDEAGTAETQKVPYIARDATSTCDEHRLRNTLKQLALGVSALHTAGKVHRDIKPQNIMVTSQGRVVLLDFGLATDAVSAEASETGLVGTPRYMAPEQAAEYAVGPSADWYAVGVVLYEALTGQVPFVGTRLEILMNKNKYEPPAPQVIVRQVPEDLSDLCSLLLRRDPLERPKGREILARLGVDDLSAQASLASVSTASSMTEHAPFVGRSRELELLGQAFDDSRSRAVMVLVHGESGMGKTSLVRRFTETLGQRVPDAMVLKGRCFERESVPYKAFDGIIDALAVRLAKMDQVDAALLLTPAVAALVRLFPVLRRSEAVGRLPEMNLPDPQELRGRAFMALRDMLQQITLRQPLVMCIDDLQWADADSFALLVDLVRPPDEPPVLIVATVQTGVDARPGLRLVSSAREQGDVREIRLEPLRPTDALALAIELCGRKGGVSERDAAALVDDAAGHPLFLQELAHEARGGQERKTRLDDIVASRLAGLGDDARRLVQILAVAGGPLSQKTAGMAAELEGGSFAKAVSLLRVAHLARSTGTHAADHIETYHNRICSAVLATLLAGRVREHHGKLAHALELSGEDPPGLIRHLEAAGDLQRAAKQAELVASMASKVLAFDQAAEHCRTALRLGKYDADETRRIRIALGDALAHAGRGREAAGAYQEAAPGADAALGLELHRRVAEQLLLSGHIDEGIAALKTVLAEVNLTIPETARGALFSLLAQRARLRLRGLRFRARAESELSPKELVRIDVCYSASLGLAIYDIVRGSMFKTRHTLLALRAGERYRLALGIAAEAGLTAARGLKSRRRTASLLAQARKLALADGRPHALAWVDLAEGLAAQMEARWQDGITFSDRADATLRECATTGSFECDTVRILCITCSFYAGDLAGFCDRVVRNLRDGERRGALYTIAFTKSGEGNSYWLVYDDPARARREAQAARDEGGRSWVLLQDLLDLHALTRCDLYEGNARAAYERLSERWPRLERTLLLHTQLIRVFAHNFRAQAALLLGSETQDKRLLGEAAREARRLLREKAPYATALGTQVCAGLAATRGETAKAMALYARAAAHFEEAGMPMHAHIARLRQGELQGGDEGLALIAAAELWMKAQPIRNPVRWARMLAPAVGVPQTSGAP